MNAVAASKPSFKYFRSPKTLIRRFVVKRTYRSASTLGIVLALYMLSKAETYLKTYTTEAARQKVAETLGNNVGVEALLGVGHHVETVAGYVTWNFLSLIAAAGAVWAFLLATKIFRGEEDSGRWEILLAGQTTARRGAANVLAGLGIGLTMVYTLTALGVLGIGRMQGASFTVSSSLFFALALIAGMAEFMAVGALASQLMPVRSRAVGLSATVFGIFYMIRLTADTTNAHWLLNLSPLGWIEKLQPMYHSQPIWLLPIGGFILVLSCLTVYLAGRRDLGEGVLADKDTAKSHTRLLTTPFCAAIRLTRTTTMSWLVSIGLVAFVYGQLAKSTIVSAVGQGTVAERTLNRLAQTSKAQTVSISAFLGITFFFVMLLAMFYAASAVGGMREDEAQGYLDNFLVRPVSRMRWLRGRVFLVVMAIVSVGLLSSLAVWVGQVGQQGGVSLHALLTAGANAMVPVFLTLSIGVFAFGCLPRLTSMLTYGAVAWSFLLVMLSSGLNLNHWLLDTSILHHVAFAPAVSANWTTNAVLVLVGIALALVGALRFNTRDLQGE